MTPERTIELAARFRAWDLNERRAKCLKLRNMALCLERLAGDLGNWPLSEPELAAVWLRTLALVIEEG